MSKLMKLLLSSAVAMLSGIAAAQSVTTSPELYPGEKTLYEAARKEGMVVSFDTGPTWANWAAQFRAFKKRYPQVEMTYNDLGSAATVIALDKARWPEIVGTIAGDGTISIATASERTQRRLHAHLHSISGR